MNLNELLDELCSLARRALVYLVLLTAAFLVTGYLANSLTIASLALENGSSIIVLLFAYQTILAMKSADPIRFPHGTGKLENFSGFLFGALTIPTGGYILFHAVQMMINPADKVSFGITQLPLIPALLLDLHVYRAAKRISARYESPLVESFAADYRVAVWFNVIVIVAMGFGLLMNLVGADGIAAYVDPVFSFGIALYMLQVAVGQLLTNFRALIDLPMPENEQLEIMRVLAGEFDAYEQLGSIRTRRSGTQRFIEVELFFASAMDVKSIAALTARMQEKLRASMKDVKLNVIVMEHAETAA
jgi:cation diffusion facilitator family transporter